MPKFIGHSARVGTQHIHSDALESPPDRVRLRYAQQVLLPAEHVMCSLDTTDRGGCRRYAKRWYRWFTTGEAINDCPHSTRSMLDRAGLHGPVAKT